MWMYVMFGVPTENEKTKSIGENVKCKRKRRNANTKPHIQSKWIQI